MIGRMILSCLLLLGVAPAKADTMVRFAATDALIAEPESGFYRAASRDLATIDAADLDEAYGEGFRLVYARIDLAPYRAKALPPAYLKKLDAGFEAARSAGVKLIVRAVYNYPRGETEYHAAKDAPLPIVLEHIAQLKPLFHANGDVIAFLQAGFIGAWGEWHTSSNDLTQPAVRTAIKDALLDALPQDRFVQFRYPPYVQDWVTTVPDLDAALASNFRIGFHNDCFLASQTDVGTFSEEADERAAQHAFIDRLGDVAPFGGETCNPADDPGATPRVACADILGEGARYNLSYLNAGYYRPMFHDAWEKHGCLTEVARRMGVRLRLIEATVSERGAPGGKLGLSIRLVNDGWARAYNARPVELVLRERTSGAVRHLALASDPRRWMPRVEQRLALDVTLPPDMPAGDYDLLLALPDAGPRLRADPRYALRPGNADDPDRGQGWDKALGGYALGLRVTVSE